MTRHPAAVYRAARAGFLTLLDSLERIERAAPRRPWDPSPEADVLNAVAAVHRGWLHSARGGRPVSWSSEEIEAFTVGARAAAAVLRVRGRRTAHEAV